MSDEKTAPKTARRPANGGPALPLGNHPGNTGGKPGRSGRRPSAVAELAQNMVDQYRLVEVVARIAAGDLEEEWYDNEGEVHSSSTKNSDRIAAVKLLLAYGYGQPTQPVEHSGGISVEHIGEASESFAGGMGRLVARLRAPGVPGLVN